MSRSSDEPFVEGAADTLASSGAGADEDDTLDPLIRAVARAPAVALLGIEVTQAAPVAGDEPQLPLVDPEHYRLGPEIARGGMGRIVAARDRRLGRDVAMKQLLLDAGELRGRFEREARITARLQHPAIVPVYEAGRLPTGEPFYVMKLVAGRSLDQVIAGAPRLEDRLALVPSVLAVAEALAYAHAHHIIHRDLKPHNVLIGEFGETVVIDWGLAKDLRAAEVVVDDAQRAGPYRDGRPGDHGDTIDGEVIGTPAYMPPEQAAGLPVDERADVYALGALLYHVMAGVPPHSGKSSAELLVAVKERDPLPLRDRQRDVPADLQAIVARAMVRSREDRYPTAKELADDLKRYLTGQLVGTHRYTVRELAWRWLRRWRAAVAVAVVALLVLAIAGALGVQRIVRERDRSEAAHRDVLRQQSVAEKALVELLEQQGRRELQGGQRGRAAVFLVEAYERSQAPSPVLRAMLGEAMRPIDAQQRAFAHGAAVTSAELSHDGQRVVTLGRDGALRLWSAGDGALVARLEGHARTPTWASFSPTDPLLLTGSDDSDAVRLWNATTGQLLRTFPARGGAGFSRDGARVFAVATDGSATAWDARDGRKLSALAQPRELGPEEPWRFTPDGAALLTSRGPRHVLWDPASGRRQITLDSHETNEPPSLSADGRSVFTEKGDHTLQWDLRSGVLVHEYSGHSPVLSDDGRHLLNEDEAGASVWEVAGHARVARLAGPPPWFHTARFAPGGALVATVGLTSDVVRLWDAATGRLLLALEGHRGPVASMRFSRDGQRLLTASQDGSARLWDLGVLPLRRTLAGHAWSRATFSPDGKLLLASGWGDRAAGLYDLGSGELSLLEGHGDGITHARFSADGAVVLTSSGATRLWQTSSRRVLTTLSDAERIVFAGFSSDGRQVITAGESGLRRWDAQTGARLGAVEVMSPAEGRVAWIGGSGNRLIVALPRDPGGIGRAASSPTEAALQVKMRMALLDADNDRLLAVSPSGADGGGDIVLWDPLDGKVVATLRGQGQRPSVGCAALSHDGATVATGGAEGSVQLWDVRSGKLLRLLDSGDGDGGRVNVIAFSRDDARVAAGSGGVITLWDPSTGERLTSLAGHHGDVTSLVFSRDGERLASGGGDDGAVKLWDTHLERRPAAVVRALVDQRVPLRLEGGHLVPRL